MNSQRVTVAVGDRNLSLSNLDKVLYPQAKFTKGEVINYYVAIAPVLLPHLHGRPVTLRRYPNGVDASSFYEKNISRHAPDWVRTVRIETPGSTTGAETLDFVRIEDLQTLVWVANLAALELHVPQWIAGPKGGRGTPDLLVFDLDPGPQTTIVECCAVALRIRELLEADGLSVYGKTSGSKGMQLYAPVKVSSPEATSNYAKRIAEQIASERPKQVTATMARAARPGKVFVDWSQNAPAKTTIAAYSLRGRDEPTASTPITWQEIENCRRPADLVFTTDDVRARVDEHGDLLAGLHTGHAKLPR